MTTSVESPGRTAVSGPAGSRFLAHDVGAPGPSQAAQYFQSVRSVRPESSAGAGSDRYATGAGRVWLRLSLQTAVAFGVGVLCAGTVAVVAFGA